jgi:NADH-quinone oxidoreductase subunit N
MVFLGSMIILISDNFIIIYLGLEIQTFSLFLLIAKNRSSIKGAESALKYFILGSISSGLFLLGITFLFSQGLSINVKDLYLLYNNSDFLIIISLFLISISLFFKLALFPFHF